MAHEEPLQFPAAVRNTLQLCWGSFLFAALVSRSLPAPSPSVAVLLHRLQARSSQHSVLFLTLHMLIPGSPLSLTGFHLPGKGLDWLLLYQGWGPALHSIVPRLPWIRKDVAGTGALFSSMLVVLPLLKEPLRVLFCCSVNFSQLLPLVLSP